MPYCLHCGHSVIYQIPDGDSRERLVCSSCGYIHYENPKVVTVVLALHQGKILLCKRAIEPRLGFWTLPAGFMELGETMEQGALREMVEEADAVGIHPRLYCLYDLPKVGQIHVFYLVDIQNGAFGVGSESLDSALFALDDLPWDDISFRTVAQTLRYYLADKERFGDDVSSYPIHEMAFWDKPVYVNSDGHSKILFKEC